VYILIFGVTRANTTTGKPHCFHVYNKIILTSTKQTPALKYWNVSFVLNAYEDKTTYT